jgi:glycosyltransferase involved in cell wall biosynthesis
VIEETKKPLVSVIMPCYKMGRFIGEALESVGKQTYTNWEVLAVDDCGPEDGTKEAVESFAKQFPNNRIIYHRHEKNGGVSAARNTAIELAQGEYLAFLDPDDIWPGNSHLEVKCREILKCNSDITYGDVIFIDEVGSQLGEYMVPSEFTRDFPDSLYRQNEIYLSTTLVNRESVIALGAFDTTPEIQHVEDWDLWIRLALRGAKFLKSNTSPVYYRRHPGAASTDVEKMWLLSSVMIRKHMRNHAIRKARSGIREMWEAPRSQWHPIFPKKLAHWIDRHPRVVNMLKLSRWLIHSSGRNP